MGGLKPFDFCLRPPRVLKSPEGLRHTGQRRPTTVRKQSEGYKIVECVDLHFVFQCFWTRDG